MLNDYEEKYVEKWSGVQTILQFQKRLIVALVGLAGFLALVIVITSDPKPIVVEKRNSIFESLEVRREPIAASEEAVGELVNQFVKLRYEWPTFNPEMIVKQLEPITTEGLRVKLVQEFGSKAHENKEGNSIEQSVSRIRPNVSEKAVLASFDRILRVNNVPLVIPTQISVLLSEGPKTSLNPLGLYVNGVIEHEER
ncbi:MAG: hypothetical protein K2X47_16120 [Bdellovibrionales bacterium]|nr:hypothetical protein [Bdellovibrionales bacterium]